MIARYLQAPRPDGKPLLRGWFHAGAAPLAALISLVMLWLARGDLVRLLTLAIFCASMVLLYSVSAVYHLGNWRGRWHTFWRSFDHANIYLVIAGTYTPICAGLMEGNLRLFMLLAIWLLATVGASTSFLTIQLPRWLATTLYLSMGWLAVVSLPQMLAVLPPLVLILLLSGGLLYSLGAVIYACKWPDFSPRYFGFHELFHLFVIAGGSCFVGAIWLALLS